MSIPSAPAAIVQRQLDACNSREVDALLSIHAEDAGIYEHPTTLLASGSAALRDRFIARFQEPNLHAQLLSRIVMGQTVTDHKEIPRTFPEGPGTLAMIMIDVVRGDRIARACSIAGAKTLV